MPKSLSEAAQLLPENTGTGDYTQQLIARIRQLERDNSGMAMLLQHQARTIKSLEAKLQRATKTSTKTSTKSPTKTASKKGDKK